MIEREAFEEHAAWLTIVELLKKTGAVSQEDCDSPVSKNSTDGQKLFNAIRKWGNKLVRLRVAQGRDGTYYDRDEQDKSWQN